MLNRCSMCVVLLVALLIAPGSRADDTDWWDRKLPNIPTDFIFGYRSLTNTVSCTSTVGAPVPAIPGRVSANFGYIRAGNDRSPSGFTALGLRKPAPGEKARTINGVAYPVEGDDVAKLDAREVSYVRVEVPAQIVVFDLLADDKGAFVVRPIKRTAASGSCLVAPRYVYAPFNVRSS
jgi:hypothetical protein